MRAVGFSISAEGTRYSVFVWWNVQHPGWRLGPGLAAGVGRRQKEGHCCGVSSLNVRAPGQRQKRETRPPSRIRILPFSKEAVRTCNPKKHRVDGWMAGCGGDVRAPAVQPRTRHSHETQVPTPNVVHSSGRGVDATQSVRSIVFGFRCWRRISSAFSKSLHSIHPMLCRSTLRGALPRDKTRRRRHNGLSMPVNGDTYSKSLGQLGSGTSGGGHG